MSDYASDYAEAMKEFVNDIIESGANTANATVRKLVREEGRVYPGAGVGVITRFVEDGVVTKEHGKMTYEEIAEQENTIYFYDIKRPVRNS